MVINVKKIKKAVIPIAGYGTRLLPITKVIPKALLPIASRPAIEYIIREAYNFGIKEFIIILNKNQEMVKEYLNLNSEYYKNLNELPKEIIELNELLSNIKIKYVIQKNQLGLANAIMCAQKEIEKDDFILLLGDDIIYPSDANYGIGSLLKEYYTNSSYYIGVKEVNIKDTNKYGIVKINDQSHLIDIVEKPQKNPPSCYACIGRYILKNTIFKYIKESSDSKEILLPNVFKEIIKKENIKVKNITGIRFDIGDKKEYMEANIKYSNYPN